jgi:hypothetical protein
LHENLVLADGDQLAEHARRHFFITEGARWPVASNTLCGASASIPLGLKFCALIPTAREPDSWGDFQTAANVTRCSTSLIRGAGSMSAGEITPRGLRISQLWAETARTADAKQARLAQLLRLGHL